jgi:hypothetical protein
MSERDWSGHTEDDPDSGESWKESERDEDKVSNLPDGDNFPTYDVIHLKLLLNRERKSLIEKLLLADELPISKDDILDWQIDVGIYNASCKVVTKPIKKTLRRRKSDKK